MKRRVTRMSQVTTRVKVLHDREALSGGSNCNAVWLDAFGV